MTAVETVPDLLTPVVVDGRLLLAIDPYLLAAGELASGLLREDAAKLNPLNLTPYVLNTLADALDELAQVPS